MTWCKAGWWVGCDVMPGRPWTTVDMVGVAPKKDGRAPASKPRISKQDSVTTFFAHPITPQTSLRRATGSDLRSEQHGVWPQDCARARSRRQAVGETTAPTSAPISSNVTWDEGESAKPRQLDISSN